jgi:hypothetical protein
MSFSLLNIYIYIFIVCSTSSVGLDVSQNLLFCLFTVNVRKNKFYMNLLGVNHMQKLSLIEQSSLFLIRFFVWFECYSSQTMRNFNCLAKVNLEKSPFLLYQLKVKAKKLSFD